MTPGPRFQLTDRGRSESDVQTPRFKITPKGFEFCGFQSNVLLRVVRDLDPGPGMTAAEILICVDQPCFADTANARQGWFENLMDLDEKFSYVEGMLGEYAQKGFLRWGT